MLPSNMFLGMLNDGNRVILDDDSRGRRCKFGGSVYRIFSSVWLSVKQDSAMLRVNVNIVYILKAVFRQ
ncbi:hypothetical protein Pcar_3190 [Syntrophotalea carbinolica DSM 2380]|uniref:Uncharacterized protein n=1 Tax=Syntrophotalea carbinolica (strain DSM 2380 / NBRC 103641 / GraBd1) TaxID=338963 RepID=Q0C6X7_SYNC1|nr:hypothetical protein Pcar_3190 [Syntrophotalea carbinolica DSM 2380]